MSSPEVYSLKPTPDQYAYAFGGREPLLTVEPGSIIDLATEDCFAGNVRSVDDLPSQVCTFPFLNPVTGPIAVRGAEPGDTIAVHFVEIVPARDWAVSTTFPHFGALTTTPPRCPPRARGAGVALRARRPPAPAGSRPGRATSPWSCRWTRCTARSASRRPRTR